MARSTEGAAAAVVRTACMTPAKLLRLLTAALAILAVAVPVAAAAKKSKPIKVSRGATTLALDAGAASALQSLGIVGRAAQAGHGRRRRHRVPRHQRQAQRDDVRRQGQAHRRPALQPAATPSSTCATSRSASTTRPDLTALVGDARASIADLDLGDADITATKKKLTVAGVVVELSTTGATALNEAFGTTAFTDELVLGEATLETRIKK